MSLMSCPVRFCKVADPIPDVGGRCVAPVNFFARLRLEPTSTISEPTLLLQGARPFETSEAPLSTGLRSGSDSKSSGGYFFEYFLPYDFDRTLVFEAVPYSFPLPGMP